MGRLGRAPVSMAVQREFWRRVGAGVPVEAAAAGAGVSRVTARRWFVSVGGVRPRLVEPSGYRLTLAEREEIACLREARCSVREIARRIGRPPSTVSRELARNSTGHRGVYRAGKAQAEAERRARRPKQRRLAISGPLRALVEAGLEKNHSPQQIARRLRRQFPNDPEMWVSHESIYQALYQALYVQGRGGLRRELTQHLRTGRSLRKPHRKPGAPTHRRGRIPGMVMISERPPEVADRAVPGHWEGDLILGTLGSRGAAGSGSAIGTLVERATRYVILLHLPHGHGALAVQEAMVAAMADLPETLRRTLTWDQGREMYNHAQIAEATGLDIYFCDPHSPWQRGSNENTNGLLRQYFPKGTDLSVHGPGILQNVADELNGRPRMTLDWATPAEALDQLLSNPPSPTGVVLTS
jgi:transposase, IS30 family